MVLYFPLTQTIIMVRYTFEYLIVNCRGCQKSHRGSKINKRKGVIISSRVGAQNVPESCTKVRKLYGRNVSPKHVGVFMSFIRVRELFFHNHHMIHFTLAKMGKDLIFLLLNMIKIIVQDEIMILSI